ncbi:MAG: dual specificity protein phosphatase family protein [Acidobacteria bacterium]|nr:dual specificity protein phosphatase family protein [Acidobacteriota bacterium]
MVDYQFITERLAVGGSVGTPENMRAIAQAGITHIVNLQIEFDDHALTDGTGVQVLWNGCDDDFLPKPPELFWKGVRFTLEALRDPKAKVLFHCAAGIHRSPMMLLAVLRVLGYEPETAMEMILTARPQADFPLTYQESVEDFVQEFQAWKETESPANMDSPSPSCAQ